MWSNIEFPAVGSGYYVSYDSDESIEYPESKATKFKLLDILNEAGISSIEEIQNTGAVVEMIH